MCIHHLADTIAHFAGESMFSGTEILIREDEKMVVTSIQIVSFLKETASGRSEKDKTSDYTKIKKEKK